MFNKLFEEKNIGNLKVKNRFVMPAMGSKYTNKEHMFTEQAANYYAGRAKGGFGLIITEYICVSKEGLAGTTQAAIYNDDFIPSLSKVTEKVHEEGGKIFAQLHHAGNQSSRNASGMMAVSASSVPAFNNGLPVCKLTTEEVWNLVDKFGDAAVRAKKAGFDGVEIHGAHAYLVAQFLSKAFNKRVDEFGGNICDRTKFACEIIKKVKEKCGSDFPVSIRISADENIEGGNTVIDAVAQAHMLEEAGADAINVSYGSTVTKSAVQPYMTPTGFNINNVKEVKKAVNIPVFCVGRINDAALAESIIATGAADFVTLGRQSVCDPEFPNKVKENRLGEIYTCTGCMQRCYYSDSFENPDDGISCMINPFSGREGKWEIKETEKSKKVLIVGAGPSGLEAAWVLAKRGHKVTICEKSSEAGGQYSLASIPPMKQELGKTIQTYVTLCKKYGVNMVYGVEVSEEYIEEFNPDLIILATGAVPVVPKIPGIDAENIYKANDVLEGKVTIIDKNVLVVGAGLVGSETTEFLLQYRNSVDIIDMIKEPAPQLGSAPRKRLLEEFKENGVTFYSESRVLTFTEDGVNYEKCGEELGLSGYDCMVLAFGARSYNPLEEVAKKLCSEVYVIGDAKKARDAKIAIYEAAKLAIEIE